MIGGDSLAQKTADVVAVLTAADALETDDGGALYSLIDDITGQDYGAASDLIACLCAFVWGFTEGVQVDLKKFLQEGAPKIYNHSTLE